MLVTIEWMEEWYDRFNNDYWNGSLPQIKFETTAKRGTWGTAHYNYVKDSWGHVTSVYPTKIAISNFYDSEEWVKKNVLLHEMIHIADYTFHPEHFVRRAYRKKYDAHGEEFFKPEARRLANFGWRIEKYVFEEEHLSSTYSEATLAKLKKSMERGNYAWIIALNDDAFNAKGGKHRFGFAKLKNDERILQHYGNYRHNKSQFDFSAIAKCHSPLVAEKRATSNAWSGWWWIYTNSAKELAEQLKISEFAYENIENERGQAIFDILNGNLDTREPYVEDTEEETAPEVQPDEAPIPEPPAEQPSIEPEPEPEPEPQPPTDEPEVDVVDDPEAPQETADPLSPVYRKLGDAVNELLNGTHRTLTLYFADNEPVQVRGGQFTLNATYETRLGGAIYYNGMIELNPCSLSKLRDMLAAGRVDEVGKMIFNSLKDYRIMKIRESRRNIRPLVERAVRQAMFNNTVGDTPLDNLTGLTWAAQKENGNDSWEVAIE